MNTEAAAHTEVTTDKSILTRIPTADIDRVRMLALIIGVVGLVLSSLGAFVPVFGSGPKQFFYSYLLAYVFWIGIALGSLAILMIQHLAGGAWGTVIRRLLEAATRTLPLMFLFFLPLFLGLHELYEWTHTEEVRNNEVLLAKSGYLNVPFFAVRFFIYFAIWGALMYLLNRWSAQQDDTADPALARRMQTLSGPGLVLFALTVTFASVDWVMSLDPEWYSTILGVLFMGGWGLSAFAFTIVAAVFLSKYEPLSRVMAAPHFHDLGKLMLAFVMLWAYFNLSQFLIIYSGNLPEEIPWYLRRMRGGWQIISVALIVLHFALPFLLLLSRDLKRNARLLGGVALFVLFMRFVDSYWLIMPQLNKASGFFFNWLNVTMMLGIGGIWIAFYAWNLKRMPLVPINDPLLESAIRRGHAHGGH